LVAAGGLAPGAGRAGESEKKPVRVGLVHLSAERPSWPYPEFDIVKREEEILGLEIIEEA